MSECWASSIGRCDRLSDEHLVSQSLFAGEDLVRVSNFGWCMNETKTIGLSSLTARILCQTHNNALSEVDAAGGRAFATFREMRRLSNARENIRHRLLRVVRYRIDGILLERWFLKTLINLSAYKPTYPIGPSGEEPGKPPPEIAAVAFGRAAFQPGAGLYTVIQVGQEIRSTDTFEAASLLRDGKIEAGAFYFRGFRFLLFLNQTGPPKRLTGIGRGDDDWSDYQLNYHNVTIREMHGKQLSQVVTFDW